MGRPDGLRGPRTRRLLGLAAAMTCSSALVLAVAPAAPAAPDPGAQKRQVDRKVDDLVNQVEDSTDALRSAYKKLHATEDKLPAARSALEKARSAADAADAAEAKAAQDLEVAKANEAKAAADLQASTKAVAAGRKRLAQFASQVYQQQGFGQLDVALSSTQPQQFADRLAMVDTVLDVQNATMQRLTSEQAGLTALEDHVSALRVDSARKQKAAAAALKKAEAARASAQQAQLDLESLVTAQRGQAIDFRDELAADKKQLAEMKAEQDRLSAVLARRAAEARARAAAEAKKRAEQNKGGGSSGGSSGGGSTSGGGSGGGGSSTGSGVLSRPVRTGWVSSEFGQRFHPIYHYWKLHSGRDYAVGCGTPVYAAASGTVISAGWGGGYGNRIVIDHGLERGVGLASTYNHLTSFVVQGGSVSRGQLIAYSGTTGTSTGCHLHFETLQDGAFVDPRKWLNNLG
ncbi:M23 family metallopeptidase [Phycicoccus sp. MAQZ13P-2]|uniref:M23 family metallopeptidase n=1 Tax=Phycicoccus mangrovi TaxID=2840470 RepID=UPI001C0009C3|nr:M23 family metallopeptidase [Phycicoccus mangrovi]MBT9255849.1 M23 family metallopeptidase [Phycicoccus mangrovi]MBT9274443.1 M23 family metallopeptidase [Phycicoccus mangrovi]